MSSAVCLYSAFDASTLQFGTLEKNKKGGKMVNLFTTGPDNAKKRVVIQTPTVAVPFGVTPYQEATTGEVQSYSLDISFRNADTDPRIADFLAKMRALDDVVLDAAVARSKEWFGKAMSKELVQEFMRRIVKDSVNKQYPPVLKIKVPVVNGQPTSQFYDENRQPVDIDYITKGSTIKMILELSPSVWFVNKNFGVTWRLLQSAVITRPKRLDSYAFADDGTSTEVPTAEAPAEPETALPPNALLAD
jgi:hypothetical protein